MSYSFLLRFIARPFPTEDKALTYAANIACHLTSDRKLIKRQLENERWYLAGTLEQADVRREELRSPLADLAIKKAISDIFSINLIYWPEHQLAALFKDTLPNELTGDLRDVVFQDGTDQDYDFHDWPDDIPLFARLKAEVLSMRDDAVAAKSPFDTDVPDIGYVRRSLLYQNIFNTLSLNDWLYGYENERFKRTTFSGITHSQLAMDIATLAKSLIM